MKFKVTKRGLFITVMLAWPLIHYLVFGLFLQIQTLLYSFKNWNPYTGKQTWVGFDNYISAFKSMANDGVWTSAIKNSLLFIPINMLSIILSLLVALVLYRKIPFARFYRIVYFFPSIISIVVVTMVFSFALNPTQGIVNGMFDLLGLEEWKRAWLGDTQTALISVFVFCIWAGIGWNNVILTGALQRIPTDYFEVGKLDGITFWNEFRYIVLPISWSTISTLIILGTSGAFTIFLQPMLLTNGGPFNSSTTVALEMYRLVVEKNSYGLAAAYGMIFALIGFVVVWTVKWLTERFETVEI
ncbi:ABC-type sugar transport system permease subunit [Paenibacillus anaericanus]|uniref:Sugar ABC transporter permease n=1 Tax=Paenibacillus anaericanus TaxID=170367 RepID=A0A433XV64_9BACL|nr:sugar ABC transporter permease [Paenibacillus anaericanus]MDQ0086876.1 ABC-type sugar transport system permease subunit [Paenibacillus anaericanus]RUT38366.1 sugar ABC transporter permease [Paenibacillus anaericanus]